MPRTERNVGSENIPLALYRAARFSHRMRPRLEAVVSKPGKTGHQDQRAKTSLRRVNWGLGNVR